MTILRSFAILILSACGLNTFGLKDDSSAVDAGSVTAAASITIGVGTGSETNGATGNKTSGPTGSETSITSGLGAGTESTTTGTTDSSGGNTTFEPSGCLATPSVMLVLDKSGSMVANPGGFWDHDQDPMTPSITRWNSLYSVVELVASNFNNSMYLGAVLFPSKTATSSYSEAACVVDLTPEVPLAALSATNILSALPAADATNINIKGATPATKGLKRAITELASVPAGQPKFIIFVTDGAANCQENAPDTATLFETYDDKMTLTIAAAAAIDIKTYIVGIDISQETSGAVKDGSPDNTNTYERLNEAALAGGVPRRDEPRFYNTTSELELQATLEMIAEKICYGP